MKLILFLIFIGFLSQAQVVVISDIDDTIKVSHVLDRSDATSNAARIDNLFIGMPELYQLIQSSTNAKMFYLTNAPRALMSRLHRDFLIKNQFPNGSLALRENIFDNSHKIRMIRQIVNQEKPQLLILVGDNGEKDPDIYYQATQEFPDLKIITYIRQAYSAFLGEDRGSELYASQMGFVTPIEVALSLKQFSLLNESQVLSLEKLFVPFALSQKFDQTKGELAFPGWQDCRDFKIPDSLLRRSTELGQQLAVFIIKRCSVPGIDTDED